MFPKLYTTRLCQMTDFYTLTLLIAKFEAEGLILDRPAAQPVSVGSSGSFCDTGGRGPRKTA